MGESEEKQVKMRILFSMLVLCAGLALPARASTLIQQAREAGVLDAQTALLYQVYAALGSGELPAQYREAPAHPFCITPLLVEARAQLRGDHQQRLAKLLQRPSLSREYLTPAGHFRIHYDLTGRDAVDGTDSDRNRVPDYVETVAATLERAWELETGELGYNPPPRDNGTGGGEEYDVYLIQLGSGGAYGFTYPEASGNTSQSYLELDNDYADPIYTQTRGLDALHATVAHEFFHAIQFGYYQGRDGIWWQEASSTWMEEVAYPEVNDYLQYLSGFLRQPEKSLDSGSSFSSDYHIYGAALFAHFLDRRHERQLIRAIWEELGRRASAGLEHFDQVIRQTVPGGLGAAMSEFAVWNYFTGSRHRAPSRYPDGETYPQLTPNRLDAVAKVAAEDSGLVDHLGSAYLLLEPRLQPGGVVIQTRVPRGRWSQQLLLIDRDSVEVRPLVGGQARIAGWDRYEQIVVVLVVTEQTGSGYEYAVSAQYDPNLTDEPIPVAFRLEQSYPNPFRPGAQAHVLIPFDLSQPSFQTRLSIFSTDGRLVRRFGPELRPAHSQTWAWDGRNEAGKLVKSGTYYYVLEGDGVRATRTLVLVRE